MLYRSALLPFLAASVAISVRTDVFSAMYIVVLSCL